MEIPEILQKLERCRGAFPREAVAEAIAHREEITPELVAILERVAAMPEPFSSDDNNFSHIFAMFLLAKFQETRAYPLVIRIVSTPGEDVFELLGDVVTENLGGILASISGGDLEPLKALVEDENANEYVRSAAMEAMVILVAAGQRPREEIIGYFRSLFHQLPRQPSYVWSGLAGYSTDLFPEEVQDEIRQAYQDGLIDPQDIHPHDIRDAMARGKEQVLETLRRERGLIEDLEEEMGWMAGFEPAALKFEPPNAKFEPPIAKFEPPSANSTGSAESERPAEFEVAEPYRRPGPKVGRNDPCPCGSGKKFKKCCGRDDGYQQGSPVSVV